MSENNYNTNEKNDNRSRRISSGRNSISIMEKRQEIMKIEDKSFFEQMFKKGHSKHQNEMISSSQMLSEGSISKPQIQKICDNPFLKAKLKYIINNNRNRKLTQKQSSTTASRSNQDFDLKEPQQLESLDGTVTFWKVSQKQEKMKKDVVQKINQHLNYSQDQK